jgi:hypothetical protein
VVKRRLWRTGFVRWAAIGSFSYLRKTVSILRDWVTVVGLMEVDICG